MTPKYTSSRLAEFGSYAFAELSALRREVAKTRRVIDMGVGDPDFPPPLEIQDALVAALAETETHRYPDYQGDAFFREAVARFFLERYDVKLDCDRNIIGLIGSKEGIFHLPLAVLNSGDVGAYTNPGYPVYRAGIAFAGAVPKDVKLREQSRFLPDFSEIPHNARLLWVNYPNNPTTACANVEFYQELVALAHERGFLIANDAAYSEIYSGEAPRSILEIPGAMDVAIEVHSLSKTFCMTGWRAGFAVGNEDAIAALLALKRNIDSGAFRAVQRAAKTAFDNWKKFGEPIRGKYAARVSRWCCALQQQGIDAHNLGGTFYVWAKPPVKFARAADFAAFLIEKTGIVALPGTAMGDAGEGYLRFSLTLPDEHIAFAEEQLAEMSF